MIQLVDLCLDHPRGGTPLVTAGNLTVTPGEVVIVVGAAGVGTSRVVAAALGEATTRSGRIEVLGRDVSRLRRSSLRVLRRKVGIVPQDLCLLEDRSAQLNVGLPLEIDGIPRAEWVLRATDLLSRLALEDAMDLPVEHLPSSSRQRVAVARALIRKPELVIADHPTSMQDATGAELVCDALADAAAEGAAVLAFGRDALLRAHAERRNWRTLCLVDGLLVPLGELATGGRTIEEVLVTMDSVRVPANNVVADEPVPNVLPFPLSARTAGVA
ncbi:MAG TPA: ATP-binding cassette domain-containing protein [Kofleriaceae bacterium]|jgi:cell division transport system ATP-binding protein|nr:ATP-binding cassette domain-containing protein [Kofleriaceae bacterium]